MKILLISYFFPPYNCIGAVRVGKMAKALTTLGHEVRVVTARDQPLPDNLEVELPEASIVRTYWSNINAPVEFLLGGRKRIVRQGFVAGGSGGPLITRLGAWYKHLLHLPDGQIGWLPHATAAAQRLARGWRPDVILASAMPYTSLWVASRVSRATGIPWVGELRDLWMDNPYIQRPWLRSWIEGRLEERVLRSACGFITVSDALAETLRARFGRPTQVVTAAYDPEDYSVPATHECRDDTLTLVYTGTVYSGRRDPSPLFRALQLMGERAAGIRIIFIGRYLQLVADMARTFGIEHNVEIREPVSHRESLRLQSEADVLLLLLWDDPAERGTFTGKLFEYLGAARPILVIGPRDNVASQLVSSRSLGVVDNDSVSIARQLGEWLDAKQREGCIPSPPAEARRGFSRLEQARVLEHFLMDLAKPSPRKESIGGNPA